MSTVDFKAVGDHAAELAGYARDNSLAACLQTLQEIAAAGKPKYTRTGDRFEVAQLRGAAYDLQRMAAEFDTVATKLLAMVGEVPDAEPATDNETDGMTDEEKREAYKSSAKDTPTGASDAGMVTTDGGGLFLGMPSSWRDKLPTAAPSAAPSWINKILGRK